MIFPGCEAGEYFYTEISKKDKINISVVKCFKQLFISKSLIINELKY
nr:MAG TPA: hypothetical protein [Caudoviricetes sp.]